VRQVTLYYLEKDDPQIESIRAIGVREVARRVGVTGGTISRWVNGKVGLSRDKFIKVGQVLQAAKGDKP